MQIPKLKQLLALGGAFLAGIAVCVWGPELADKLVGGDSWREDVRVASPDQRFDAVILQDYYGGAVGGIDSYVYIVAKGKSPNLRRSAFPKYVSKADPLRGERLTWDGPHSLAIHYDVSEINYFRNLWCLYEIQDTGPSGERNFCVEIRLAPSSDSSIVGPDGNFRQ